ncbi:MAG: class I SAM-dependent methyltransferase [Candidatus Saccharibacteria bacterium]
MPTQNYTEFTDPMLVTIYDAVNPISSYVDFYLSLADELNIEKVIDLGCGTGLLSNELVKKGHEVIGIEPAPEMLKQAKKKYGNEAEWIAGSAEALRTDMQADLVIMAGHVAQFFLDDDIWQQALRSMYRALKPGGYLVFESRNPLVRPFADWPTKSYTGQIPQTPLGPVEWWPENLNYDGCRAVYELHYHFKGAGKELISANELRFRTKEEITETLQDAGFMFEYVYGDWASKPFANDDHEMIFLAKKA